MVMNVQANIILIGMPGSGKTSLGLIIAERLGLAFCDIDQYIQKKENKSISELFLLGESHFRQLESNAVRDVSSRKPIVIATGGGVVTRTENIALLQETGTIFYIDRPIEMIIKSTDFSERPLLADNVKRIYDLYEQRKHLYEESCHYRITNELPLDSVADLVLKMIK
jgi:shikimate kinase